MKRICSAVIVLVAFITVAAYAQSGAKPAVPEPAGTAAAKAPAVTPAAEKIIDAGNKSCPISGEPVSGSDFVVYKGVRYGLCCASCKELFLKEPDKYIQKLKEKGEIK